MSECNAKHVYQCLLCQLKHALPYGSMAYTSSTGYAVGCPRAHILGYLWTLLLCKPSFYIDVKHRQTHLQQLRNVETASWSRDDVCFAPGGATAYA